MKGPSPNETFSLLRRRKTTIDWTIKKYGCRVGLGQTRSTTGSVTGGTRTEGPGMGRPVGVGGESNLKGGWS